MKILMALADSDNSGLAVVEFKKLNAANSIDFVETADELMAYLNYRADYKYELPDLLLLGLVMDGRDALSEIKANPKLAHIPVITFSIYSHHENGNSRSSKLNEKIFSGTNPKEFGWVVKEVCDRFINREGWQYNFTPPLNGTRM